MITSSHEAIPHGQAIPAAKKSLEHPLLSPHKFIPHHPKFGVNPLVDAAGYLFSLIGKLKQIKEYQYTTQLSEELLLEINRFQEAARTHHYASEFILVARFALAATLDDIILNTSWGTQETSNHLSLLTRLNPEPTPPERFFVILERISKDPATYIDLMEFMYICLSLGFKGPYRATEFNHNQLEQITYVLYKNIRIHRGDFNKSLSPFPIKTPTVSAKLAQQKTSITSAILTTLFVVIAIFISLGILLDLISKEAYQELMHIGNLLLL